MIDTNLSKTQDLFQKYPLRSLREFPGGGAPVRDGLVPYHVYNGTVLLIGGTANLASVRALLNNQNLEPVRTSAGEALVSLWVCNFTQSSLGPHKMLQAGTSVALGALPPVEPQPLALLGAVLTMPQVGMYCRRTWVDEARVAVYQSELFGLDVHLTQGEFSQDLTGRNMEFEFWDVSDGETLLSGRVRERAYTTPRPALALLRRLGLSGLLQVTRQPNFSLRVVPPLAEKKPAGGLSGGFSERISQVYWRRQRSVTQFFNPHSDRLVLSSAVYPGVEFRPQFIERLEGFKMVYLLPGKSKG
jgi:hypothetical protein